MNVLEIVNASVVTTGLTRIATWNFVNPLYGKNLEITVPSYCVKVEGKKTIDNIKMKMELERILGEYSKSYHVKIFDVHSHVLAKIDNQQMNLSGDFMNKSTRDFFSNNLMILDFASDLFYYKSHLNTLSKCKRFPKKISYLAKDLEKHSNDLDNSEYTRYADSALNEFWEDLLSDERNLMDFEREIHTEGIRSQGDIVLPFTKLIRTKKDVLDVERINKAWRHWNMVEENPVIAYVPLHMSALGSEAVVDEICDYIVRLKSDVLVMKVKNLEVAGPTQMRQRELFQKILKAVAKKKYGKKQVLTVFLEAGYNMFVLSLQAFDIVSASATFDDKERGGGSGGRRPGISGKAIDENTLGLVEFEEWQRRVNEIGEFPCTHGFCQSRITTMDEPEYRQPDWSTDLRRHNMLCAADWMRMIPDSVREQTIDVARNRILNSPYVLLSELLVYIDSA